MRVAEGGAPRPGLRKVTLLSERGRDRSRALQTLGQSGRMARGTVISPGVLLRCNPK